MALTFMLLVPLVSAILLLAFAADARLERPIAIGGSVLTLGLALLAVITRPVVDAPWITAIGVRWHFGIDGISVALVLLTALLGVAVVMHTLSGPAPAGGNRSTLLGCLLLVEAGAMGTFLAADAILFFVAFEVVLVPMWFIIRRFGDDHVPDESRADASGRFVFFTALGSTLMLLGIITLVVTTGTSDLVTLANLGGRQLSYGTQVTIAVLLVGGLAIKVPVWPLHTWLPPAHTVAPTVGSVLLAAVLLKMGTYGIVRLVVPIVPEGLAALSPFLAVAGVMGILWGGLACLVERDLKRLIAYSSVAHMGFVILAIASGSHTGLQAALFGNIAHGVVAALLFFVVGDLKQRWGSVDLGTPRVGLRDAAPRYGVTLLFGLAAALGLPGLVSFWGEFLALYAAWSPAPGRPLLLMRVCVVLGAMGLALAAAYALRVARLVWAGEVAPAESMAQPAAASEKISVEATGDAPADARGARWVILLALTATVVLLGVMPRLLLDLSADDALRMIGLVLR